MPDPKTILQSIDAPDAVKADAWDALQSASSPDEFKARLERLPFTPEVKAALWETKATAERDKAKPQSVAERLAPGDANFPLVEMAKGATDVVESIGSGALNTARGFRDIGYKLTGHEPPKTFLGSPTVTEAPDSVMAKIGRFAEQGAEFILPISKVNTAVKAAPLLGRMAAEGAASAGVSAVQSGGDPGAIRMGAIIGSLGPLLGGAIRAAYGAANETLDAFLVRNPDLKGKLLTAIEYAKAHGIPLTVGQELGNESLITTEQQLAAQPGSSRIAQSAGIRQDKALMNEAQTAANRINPTTAGTGVESAEALNTRLVNRMNASKDWVNKRYEQVRGILKNEQNTQQRVIGQKASTLVDEKGNPYTTDIVATYETPIDISARQRTLRPLYDEIQKQMPEAQRQLSPGYTALKQIVEGDSVMDAETLDKNLGAIKALIRRQGRDYLPTRSTGIAMKVVSELEKDVEAAYGAAGGGALEKLQRARIGVKDYHYVDELLSSLPKEPGQLYARLLQGEDKRLNLLKDLQQYAPNEVRQIGNTFIQGLIDKLTAGGQIGRARGVIADFGRIGPESKKILFGNVEQANEFGRFLTTVEELTRLRNPSGSAASIANLNSATKIFKAIKNYGQAKLLMEPGGPEALRTLLVAPQGSRMWDSANFLVQKLSGQDRPAPALPVAQ